MKKILTAAVLGFICTFSAALKADDVQKTAKEMVLPLKVKNGILPGWSVNGIITALDNGQVQIQMKEWVENAYQASAFYVVGKPQPGEWELILELSTQSQGFFTILFYSPLYQQDDKVERRYIKLPLDQFDTKGALRKYSIKFTVPEGNYKYAGFGIEFRSKQPGNVIFSSAKLIHRAK